MDWKNKEVEYPWSSYGDYKNNRWEGLLCTGVILDQFDTFEEYEQFVTESILKETLNKLLEK